ncbi:uncharacterized protein K02A2.6-like isoform X1 [Leguminivora glycinivorella]|uniref:uncharacterized protein K02A2.6-like isoform X1 n=1 Tax=Leguminivora glycinivorella TaxID=1035111 RepID=UPI00200DF46C|nr:uncharacterized protein K02A2.6-like isoform X1 [Leguminivora glycinivorella]
MLSAGVIEPVDASDWATPLVPIRKPDGSLRLCADYKVTLNKVLLVDKYPVPRLEDVFSSLSGSTYFTKLDLSQAYSQVVLDDESKKYTVINTHRGLFSYNRLVFGLASSPGIFQRLMSTLLQGIDNVVVFYDDILITGSNLKQHLITVNTVLDRLQAHGLKLKKEKCVFLQDKVRYLGYVIDKSGLSVDKSKIKPILEMPYPSNVSQLRSFLGMVNFYAKFVKDLSNYLAPLHALLQKYTRWQWGEKQIDAFNRVKSMLSSAEVLAHYDPGLDVVVTSDASPFAVGAILAHRYADGSERPLAYASRALTAAERNYSQIHKEALSIYFAVKRFHQYLYGRRFSLRTDHKPLVSIFGPNVGVPSMTASRLQRWALCLSAYDFDIEYVKSEQNVADVLSRLIKAHKLSEVENEKREPEQTYLHFASDALLLDYKVLKNETKKDPLLSRVTSFILDGWPDAVDIEQLKPYFNRRNELYLELGVIMWGHRVVIPVGCQDKVIRELHETHMGVVKTKSLARSYAWFPGIDEAIERTCTACGVCAATASAPPAQAPRAWPWPERPWTRLHIDFLGPLAGIMYLVIVDACSKWIEVIKMASTTAAAVISKLREIWARFGIPKQVVSDNGPPFTSQEFGFFMKNNGVEHIFTAPYHPSSNGAAEGAVKICKHVLLKAQKQQLDAEVALSRFLLIYRNTVHSTTGDSPANILQGRGLRTRLDCLKPERGAHAREAQARQQRAAGGAHRSFLAGDTIWYRNYSSRNADKWLEGTIKESLGSSDYALETSKGEIVHRHVDQIKRRSRNSLWLFPGGEAQSGATGSSSPGSAGPERRRLTRLRGISLLGFEIHQYDMDLKKCFFLTRAISFFFLVIKIKFRVLSISSEKYTTGVKIL